MVVYSCDISFITFFRSYITCLLKQLAMKIVLLATFLLLQIQFSCCFDIFRSECRKSGIFKVTDRERKVQGGLVSAVNVVSLSLCLKYCLDSSTCKTFNFKVNSSEVNCELLSVTRSVTGTVIGAVGWRHYEPIQLMITPGCIQLGSLKACSPGYRCEDSCHSNERFKCIDINECTSNPCLNGGVCTNLINRFSCSCPGGYTGTRCEIDINECASNPCLNGGVCTNLINRFSCSCPGGYTGSRCHIDINECASSPCYSGGTCYNHVNYYSCSCKAGYRGSRCQSDINECASSPCYNGGHCQNHVNHYTCSCVNGHHGSRCQHAPAWLWGRRKK